MLPNKIIFSHKPNKTHHPLISVFPRTSSYAFHGRWNPLISLLNKQFMMIIGNYSNVTNPYNIHSEQVMAHPLIRTTTTDTLLPMYATAFTESINLDSFKADSGLTYSLPLSRKRSRDMYPFTFLGQDISSQVQQQHLEIDQLLAHHTENVRVQIEERRKRNSRTIIAALEEGMAQRLRAKEEEIVKMAKLNWALEEKVKALCMENQIWREIAQTNEATANALRTNLKQVLEQVVHDDYRNRNTTAGEDDAAAMADDAQSCCESNNEDLRSLAEQDSSNSNMKRWCKSCGKAESCVLLLPCRHLCLCTVCASSVNICPICKSTKNISIHVHMS